MCQTANTAARLHRSHSYVAIERQNQFEFISTGLLLAIFSIFPQINFESFIHEIREIRTDKLK